MAKKQETVEVPVVETPVVETPKPKKPEWEIKNRVYYLKGKKPLSHMIRSANIYWFDENKGFERELKYCENQQTCFVDEMKGDQRLEHIIFRNGVLFVERSKTVLQKLLSIYHPHKESSFCNVCLFLGTCNFPFLKTICSNLACDPSGNSSTKGVF